MNMKFGYNVRLLFFLFITNTLVLLQGKSRFVPAQKYLPSFYNDNIIVTRNGSLCKVFVMLYNAMSSSISQDIS
jgi:hypothetical protein